MKVLLLCLFFLNSIINISCAQSTSPALLNLDFETIDKNKPALWSGTANEGYAITLDSAIRNSGKYSYKIESIGDKSSFATVSLLMPYLYDGKQITLSGYIKTENVSGGYAGFWARIDPEIAFDNMGNRGITGTTDWKKYEITLNLKPEVTKQIYIGALLVGKGKMWIDNLHISIDGKNIDSLKPMAALKPRDNEFDNGSKIISIDTGKTTIDNLRVLGMLWGFLKYYHPVVTKGAYDWDYELFRIIPKIAGVKNHTDRDRVLHEWIRNIGEIGPSATKASLNNAAVKMRPDLDWIENSGFSSELSSLLIQVKNSKKNDYSYYLDYYPNVGNPIFKAENAYKATAYPDAGFRILSLFRYWNMIQYHFPYKYLIQEDWKNVLAEFLPKFISASNDTEYHLAVLRIISRIHDTHANIYGNEVLNNYFGKQYAVPQLKFVDNNVVVVDFYDAALGAQSGMLLGDVITEVNGKKVADIVKANLPITPASNYPTQLRNIAQNLLRSNDSLISIKYMRNKKLLTHHLKTYSAGALSAFNNPVKKNYFEKIGNDIAYLYPGSIKSIYLDSVFKEMKDTKGLVIDLRCYPSDFIVFTLGNRLVDEPQEFVKFSKGQRNEPGLFLITEPVKVGNNTNDYYKGKVVIIVDETTQSQAEYTAMAFRVAKGAIVIGSTTAGADGNVANIYLPGKIHTWITGIGIYYPDGKETQRVGIVPDIETKPTIQGIREGRDELLDKAIEVIKKGASK